MQPTFVRRIKALNRRHRGAGSRTRKSGHVSCTKLESLSPSKPVAVSTLAINATILTVEDVIPASPIAVVQPPPSALECSLNAPMDVEVVPERSISLEEELFHSMFAYPSYLDASPEPASSFPADLNCITPLAPTPSAFPSLCSPLPASLFEGASFAEIAFKAGSAPASLDGDNEDFSQGPRRLVYQNTRMAVPRMTAQNMQCEVLRIAPSIDFNWGYGINDSPTPWTCTSVWVHAQYQNTGETLQGDQDMQLLDDVLEAINTMVENPKSTQYTLLVNPDGLYYNQNRIGGDHLITTSSGRYITFSVRRGVEHDEYLLLAVVHNKL